MKVKNFIFVATSGRSGSGSLARILQAGENIRVEHEPNPVMYNDYPDGLSDKQQYFHDLFYNEKLNTINSSSLEHDHYAETNHLFIKNFADFAIEEFADKIRIIHLYRDPVSVATSFYRIGSIPGKTERGKLYLIDPMADDNILDMRDAFTTPEFADDLYRCLWYWYEVEARIQRYKTMYQNIAFHPIETSQLNNFKVVKGLFQNLGISFKEMNLRNAITTRVNTKTHDKKNDINSDHARKMNAHLKSYLAINQASLSGSV